MMGTSNTSAASEQKAADRREGSQSGPRAAIGNVVLGACIAILAMLIFVW